MTLDEIEMRLRTLAGKFTGVEMGHRLPPSDHGAARSLGITFVNDRGEDCDVGDELLEIADQIGMLSLPTITRFP
jgi:hypothetical protein